MRSGDRAKDGGASLIIVLIIVTVVSLVMGAVLTLADTNLRATVQLRDQTKDNYGADAAAQAAVTQLQQGKLTCNSPTVAGTASFGSATTPFYAAAQTQGAPLNASATCIPDTHDGANTVVTTTGTGVTINSSNDPTYALLTVGTSTAEDGQTYAGNKTVCVDGGSVVANSTINLAGQGSSNSLAVGVSADGAGCSVHTDAAVNVQAAGTAGCNGLAADSNPNDFPVTPCTHLASPVPPTTWKTFAPIPSDPITATDPAPLCFKSGSTTYAAFRAGKYDNVALLNKPCSNKAADFEWFVPGTYYFDFGATAWTWPTRLVGGTPQNASGAVITALVGFNVADTTAANMALLADLSPVTAFPGSCADPSEQSAYSGVEFVFGGASSFTPASSGTNEICATYSGSTPPVAIYGVSQEVVGASLNVTGGSVTAETLCTSPPCTSSSTGTASLINTGSNGQNSFYVQGFTYAPSARISLTFKNSGGQVFGWGLLLRSFDMTVNGTSSTAPFIIVRPAFNAGQTTTTTTTYTIRYINVWTCAASGTPCPQTGPPDVTVKVQTNADGTNPKVLSWSEQR